MVERIKPFDDTINLLCRIVNENTEIVYVEEGIKNGGAGMITKNKLAENNIRVSRFEIVAIDDSFVIPDYLCEIYDYAGLSAEKISMHFEVEK